MATSILVFSMGWLKPETRGHGASVAGFQTQIRFLGSGKGHWEGQRAVDLAEINEIPT